MFKAVTFSDLKSGPGFLPVFAWGTALLVSLLPDILFRELTGELPAWLLWAKVGFLAAMLLLSLMWNSLREIRLFFVVLLSVYLLGWAAERIYQVLDYRTWFVGFDQFMQEMLSVQIPRFTIAVLLVLIMLILVRSFEGFFFVKGKLDAEAAPIPLIMEKASTWRVLGPAIAGAMCLGLMVFILAFGSLPSLKSLAGVLPLLPFVLLFAASNAFGEEMIYRAPWLAALEGPLGPVHALLITAVFFGIEHFYGVPYGVLGVVMAFIPGWLMGKAMLETRGFLWAWLIHISMDIVIFFFMALGSVVPGG